MPIVIAPQFTQRTHTWTGLSAVSQTKKLALQCEADGTVYTIWGYDGPEVHLCTIWQGDVPEHVVASGYTQIQNDLDKAAFEYGALPFCNSSVEGPREADKKPVVTVSPATEGWLTWVTGRKDQIPPDNGTTGRGLGEQISVTFTTSDAANTTKTFDIQFLEPMEIHDGQVSWSPVSSFEFRDTFSLKVVIPATEPGVNVTSTGNCNKIEIYPNSGMHVIIPAAGDGAWDLNMSDAHPVWDKTNSAYWNADYITGEVTPSLSPGTAAYNLFDFDAHGYLLKSIGMGNPLGLFDVDVYKSEWFHPTWILRLEVTKTSPANGNVGGWLFCFRKFVQ